MIVVGVDGSGPSDRALRWAAAAAEARGLPLRIIYAAPDPGEAGQHVVREAGVMMTVNFPAVRKEVEVVRETPAKALIAASHWAAMVVVGNRGHGGFHDLLLGSTSLYTAMHAHCPVAVIRPVAKEPSNPEVVDRVVVGVDGSPHSVPALDFAFDEADRTGRSLIAVHAWQGDITAGAMGMPYVYDPIDRQAAAVEILREAVAPWLDRFLSVDVHQTVVQMPAAAALVQYSQGAYLTTVGCRGLGGVGGALLGSVGQALIHHAGCPVVIAHDQH